MNKINTHSQGDFLVNESLVFEVGGKNKSHNQIKGIEEAYLAVDVLEVGFKNKIPLYLFGFLY